MSLRMTHLVAIGRGIFERFNYRLLMAAPISLCLGKPVGKVVMDLITNDKSHFVERISKTGLTSKTSQHEFLIVRSTKTNRVTNLTFFTFHGSAAFYPTNTISACILADATWNAACALSEVPILNQSWLTWAAGPSRAAHRALNETLAARGYPNLQKGRDT